MKKIILLALTTLMFGCGDNITMEGLDIANGTKYVVISKSERPRKFTYSLIKVGSMDWYDYSYRDTTDFNIGDTLVITVKRVGN